MGAFVFLILSAFFKCVFSLSTNTYFTPETGNPCFNNTAFKSVTFNSVRNFESSLLFEARVSEKQQSWRFSLRLDLLLNLVTGFSPENIKKVKIFENNIQNTFEVLERDFTEFLRKVYVFPNLHSHYK